MITGVHSLSIIASGEASVAFYKRLGFSETFRTVRDYDTVVIMSGYGMSLELFIDPRHPRRANDPENLGLRHLSLKVDSCEEMRKQFDCQPTLKDWFGVNYCYTTDPDGLPIRFHE